MTCNISQSILTLPLNSHQGLFTDHPSSVVYEGRSYTKQENTLPITPSSQIGKIPSEQYNAQQFVTLENISKFSTAVANLVPQSTPQQYPSTILANISQLSTTVDHTAIQVKSDPSPTLRRRRIKVNQNKIIRTKPKVKQTKVKNTCVLKPGVCQKCPRTQSIVWRRGPSGPHTLCNACGLKYIRSIKQETESKQVRNVRTLKSGKSGFCQQCQCTESPEWRRGPFGPHTLCNACGLRYSRKCKKSKEINKGKLSYILN